MEKARLAILAAELNKQADEIAKIYIKISKRAKKLDDETKTESLAYQLHNLYCSFEDLFKIVANAFENNIEEGTSFHKELLRRMGIPIKGIRPNLISEESLGLLSELRAFRHFFRHAYTYELDAGKIKFVLEKALKLKDIYKKDIDGFIAALKR